MRLPFLAMVVLCAVASSPARADDMPDWVKEAISAPAQAYGPKVPGVILLRDETQTVEANGHVVVSFRTVAKILTLEGRQGAQGSTVYLASLSKVRALKAWLITPSGETLKLGKELEFDRAFNSGDLYNDIRIRGIDARSKADVGSIFAFEDRWEEQLLFNQLQFHLQYSRWPVAASHLSVAVPKGWRLESQTFNHDELKPSAQGDQYTWVAQNLPFLEPEPLSPTLESLETRIAVSLDPNDGARFTGHTIRSWKDASRWMTDTSAAQSEPDADVLAKAKELTQKSNTVWDKLRAIAYYTQTIRYVSILLGTERGGGYRPRPSNETLEKQYGDCKDKATLMKALLKASGIPAYLVLVNSGDRSYVREEWPSPRQFNHAIVAISLPDGVAGAGPVLNVPGLGRVLFFDPTAGNTPLGDLPLSEQGGFALLVAGDQGQLLRLPFSASQASGVERSTEATIDSNGTATVKVLDRLRGQQGAGDRAVVNSRGADELKKVLEQYISQHAAGARISNIALEDHFFDGRFDVLEEFVVPVYAQMRGNQLMIFKPVILGRRQSVFLTEPKRKEPVLLNPYQFHETAHIKLPANFKVDELPNAENIDTPFGRYSAKFEVKDGTLSADRTFEIHPSSVPVAQYPALREFYERILSVEQTPVVLLKQ